MEDPERTIVDELLRLDRRKRGRILAVLEASLQAPPLTTLGALEAQTTERIRRGALQEALELIAGQEESITDWKAQIDLALLKARATVRMGQLTEALRHARRALRWAEEHDCRHRQALAHWELGRVASFAADRKEEVARLERAQALLPDVADPSVLLRLTIQQGFAHHESGDLERAQQLYDQALATSERLGWRTASGLTWLYSGWLLVEQGADQEARARLERACAMLSAADEVRYVGAACYGLAYIHLRASALGAARDAVADGHRTTAALEDGTVKGLLLAVEGAIAARAYDVAHARRILHRAREALLEAGDTVRLRTEAVFVLEGLVDLAEGKATAARRRLDEVRRRHGRRPACSDLRVAIASVDTLLGHAGPVLVIGPEAESFSLDAAPPVSLARRHALRGIVKALAENHRPMTWQELFAAGWPGEHAVESSGYRRVRTAIWTLRGLGLKPVIETTKDGYRFADDCLVERSGPPA